MHPLLWRSYLYFIAACNALLFFLTPARAGTFKNPLIIPTSSDVLSLATADINHDGKLDLIYVDGQGYGNYSLHVLLGNGNGTFSHGQDTRLPAGICCTITVADVTGDGNPDIIMQGSQQFTVVVAVMVGNGDGTLQLPLVSTFQPASIGGYPTFNGLIGVGDINGDGKADLVLNDGANGEIYLLLGDNSGKFTLSSTILANMRNSVYLMDLNGDQHLDIVATDLLGADFTVFLGNGNGSFQTGVRYTGQPSTGAFILADMDGDGHPDMLTEYYPAQLGIFKGNPDGTFAPLSSLGSATFASPLIGVSDFNSDGIPDLTFSTPTGVGIELGTGNLNYSPMKMTVSGSPVTPFAIPPRPVTGDFNTDGHMDLAMPVEGGIAILLGKGDGTFASADFYDMGQQVGAVAVADFNGDKLPDISVTLPAPFPRLLLGNGQGTFTLGPDPNASYGSQSPDTNMEAADFNEDGKIDLDMGTQTLNGSSLGTQSVAFGLGNGTFTNPMVIQNGSPIVADLNSDGRSDIISVNGATVTALLGQVNETFSQVTTPLRLGTALFGVGDVNKDGKPDLVLNYSDHLEIWLGRGDGTFSYSGSIDNNGLGFSPILAVADVDGDGNADIILGPISTPASSFSLLTIFYGNGDGTFQAPVSLPTSHRYTQVVVTDVNGDNKPDLLMTDGSGIAVMTNLGGRKFDSETYYVAGGSVSRLSVTDVNGDGFPDIVVANSGGTTVTVLLNQPNGTSLEGAATTGTLAISPEPSVSGQPFTISLAVSGAAAGATVPTGSVSFSIDGAFVAAVPLANGIAAYSVTSTLIPIQHTIVATYDGDSVYAPKNFAALHSVLPPTYVTQTALAASPATVLASQTVRLVATVTSTPPVPSGIVTFLDGTNTLGAAVVDSTGSAYHDTALLSIGTHTLTASYQGFTQAGFTGNSSYTAAIFSPSISSPTGVVVNANATTTMLSSSTTSPTAGTVVTFTANVGSATSVPFGGATFYDGSSALGTSALKADGSATFSTASLTTAAHSITAAFNANGPFAGSTSTPINISVQAAAATALTTLVSLAPEASLADDSSTLVASISSSRGLPAGTVTFLDSGTILGTAVTGQSAIATLRIGTLRSGMHNFAASFSGGSEFAPSVSPALNDQWPKTGQGFTVILGARTLRITPAGSEPLQITIEPLSTLWQQQVQLSCASGLPHGYECTFSPSMLNGKGVSTLTIRRIAKTAATLLERAPLFGFIFGLVSFVLLGSLARCSRGLVFLAMVICCSLGFLCGCGAAHSGIDSQRSVLTIQAISGTGPEVIVHSTQVTLVMTAGN